MKMLSRNYQMNDLTNYRIGMIVPSSNTTMEREVPQMLRQQEAVSNERFSFHASRVRMTTVDTESLLAMNKQAERAAIELSDASANIMLYACLVAIMVEGPGAHRTIESRIEKILEDQGYNTPVVTSAGALVDTLQEIGTENVGLIAPYMPSLTNKVCEYLQNEGINVASRISLAVADNEAVGRLNPHNLLRLLDQIPGNVDAIVLSACVQMPSLDVLAEAERITGIRVVTAASATVYQTLKKLHLPSRIEGYGSVLKSSLVPSFFY